MTDDTHRDEPPECAECGLKINGQWAVEKGTYYHPDCYDGDPPKLTEEVRERRRRNHLREEYPFWWSGRSE